MTDLIKLYKEHINPDMTPYEIHHLYSSFNLTLWVKHWDPEQQRVQENFIRERHALAEKWILENSTLKPRIKMDAKTARQKATEHNRSKLNEQISEIQKRITEASGKGKYNCFYYGIMENETKDLLESEGYKISTTVDPKEQGNINYTIKW